MSISDSLIASAFRAVEAVHGQLVTVLTGADAGKTYTAVFLVEQSIEIESGDTREKVMAHFRRGVSPSLDMSNQIQDSDGQIWKVVNRKDNPADRTVDFELVKIVSGKDT